MKSVKSMNETLINLIFLRKETWKQIWKIHAKDDGVVGLLRKWIINSIHTPQPNKFPAT